jgi:hypothetical protein
MKYLKNYDNFYKKESYHINEKAKKTDSTDFSIESTNPGTLNQNDVLLGLLNNNSSKMSLYKSFAVNIPKGQITKSFVQYINSLDAKESTYMFNLLGSLKSPEELTPNLLYGNRNSAMGRLFDLKERGTGKGELAIAWLIKNAKIQGGAESYDLDINGKKYEIKDWSSEGNTPILTGVKSKVTNFEFWREIVDTLRRLDKLVGYSTKSKFDFSLYFPDKFVKTVSDLLSQQSNILSGEVGIERLNLLKDFYIQASQLNETSSGYTNLILRGPNEKPIELSIMPLSVNDIKGDTITITKASTDNSLTYIITELKRLKYVRQPSDFDKDLQIAVDQITEGITYIVFRKNKINIVSPGGFKPHTISISSLKFIEKDL